MSSHAPPHIVFAQLLTSFSLVDPLVTLSSLHPLHPLHPPSFSLGFNEPNPKANPPPRLPSGLGEAPQVLQDPEHEGAQPRSRVVTGGPRLRRRRRRSDIYNI